jgi:diacylglycerol kinase family enzyme
MRRADASRRCRGLADDTAKYYSRARLITAVAARSFAGPVCIVVNGRAGSAEGDARRDELAAALGAQGLAFEFFSAASSNDMPACAARAVQRAQREQGLVVAVGGDGTINTVAQALQGSQAPLGVLPAGTFNYFARAHELPEKTERAVALWREGEPQPVQAGWVNDQLFVVNASIGLYPKLLRAREEDNARLGRWRLVAAWAALRTVLRDNRSLRLELDSDGRVERVRTPTLFVGNNPLQLEQFGLPHAPTLHGGGALAAVRVRPLGRWPLIVLALRGLVGSLGPAPEVSATLVRELRVAPRGRRAGRPLAVAFDGELRTMPPPLHFRVAPAALRLIKPAQGGGE